MKMQKLVFTCLLLAFGYFGLRSFAQEPKTQLKDVPEFDVRGISFTECACTAYACPCRSNGHPTKGSCDAADFTFIREGYYGNVDMAGFKAVLVGDVIDMDASKVHATGYFDEKTTPEQRRAFGEMMDFMFGWNPPHMVGTKIVPIEFIESADKTVYTLKVPGILEEKAIMKRDERGKPLHEVPAMDLWGNKIAYADNVVFKYHDAGVGEWDLSGHQANVKEFHSTKDMYVKKQLLLQHGDMSGNWTSEQKEMIKKMGMKPE